MEKNQENIQKTIYQMILEEIAEQSAVVLNEDMYLIEDLAFDSIRLMSLLIRVEEEFKIDFADTNLLFESYNRIGDLCSLVGILIDKKEGHAEELW